MQTPFMDQLAAVAARGPRFFVPGHKGSGAAFADGTAGAARDMDAILCEEAEKACGGEDHALHPGAMDLRQALAAIAAWDLTEVEGADDLSHPVGALAQSQANMTRAYGSGATLYSASGASSCICAMLALFVGAGGQVVMARGCHVAAVRALAFLDARPVWVPLADGRVRPAEVEAALVQSGAGAVYVTSPDYYGRMADVPALAEVCARHGAALLVDNAHGAYLRFLRPSRHPISLGADACADSAHKTLPCLTPAALLHLRDAGLAEKAREALNLFCSTSPAYPVLASLDYAAGLLLDAPPDFAAAARRFAGALAAFPAVVEPCDDPLRACLRPAAAGLAPEAFYTALLKMGIAPEYYDGERLVLMASPWNSDAEMERLAWALAALRDDGANAAESAAANVKATLRAGRTDGAGKLADAAERPADAAKKPAAEEEAPDAAGNGAAARDNQLPDSRVAPADPHAVRRPLPDALPLPRAVCGVRQALFGPRQRLPVRQAVGRVAAGIAAPCPPGVPVLVPGEEIDPAHADFLLQGGILALDVVK